MSKGKVYLVGAGPGDEKLITVKGLDCLRKAEVVVYDRLANPRLLRHANPEGEFIYCGKLPNCHTLNQEAINQVLVEKGKAGKIVVRLKGGDPMVFGRAGEEAQELANHGIPFEIVPGITSGIAAPAYAGIPVTHREFGNTFAVISGHTAKGGDTLPEVDWEALAKGLHTLIFYMGLKNLPSICDRLMAHGRKPHTPVALVQWGTTGHQRTLTATLHTAVEEARSQGFTHPVIILVGEIASLRDSLSWIEKKPLFGQRILVARSDSTPGMMAEYLGEAGAEVMEYPTYYAKSQFGRTENQFYLDQIETYGHFLFTSAESVDFFFKGLQEMQRDVRKIQGEFLALSPRIRRRLLDRGYACGLWQGQKLDSLLILGEEKTVQDSRWQGKDVITLYEKKNHKEVEKNVVRLLEKKKVDTYLFPGPSSVKSFIQELERKGLDPLAILGDAKVVCLGEQAVLEAEEAGIKVTGMVEHTTYDVAVEYLASLYSNPVHL